jgi:CheY-like chemotaxis protein
MLTTLGVPHRATPDTERIDAFVAKPVHSHLLLDALARLVLGETTSPSTPHDGPAAAIAIPDTVRNLRVLVAEDNAVNQKLAVLMLRRAGVTADVVANGLEAVEAVIRQRYDLVLMDVHMPEMDGLQATSRIREQLAPDRQPRIIAVSAGVTGDEIKTCRDAGMDDFLGKPFKLSDLTRVLIDTVPTKATT